MRPILQTGLLAVIAAGCGAPRPVATAVPVSEAPRVASDAGAPLWAALDRTRATPDETGPDCLATFGTYGWGFGLRGLACDAAATPLGPLAAAAGVPVFLDGPHAPGSEGLGLDLASRRFGHYNPAFVQWAVDAAVGADGPVARAAVQPVYRRAVQRLARVYWLTYAGLAADGFPRTTPAGFEKDYVVYLRGGPTGAGGDEVYPGFTMTAFNERTRSVPEALGIGLDDLEWFEAQYEANTAVGFWLRRREDGTLDAFHDGLRRVLATYDADWLSQQG